MNASESTNRLRLIAKLWGQQLFFLLLISGLIWQFNSISAYSILLGGLIFWLPNTYFSVYAFRFHGASAAVQILRSMYLGEVGKFVLTLVGFALTFTTVQPLNVISLFIAYISMVLSHYLFVSCFVGRLANRQ